MYFQSKKFCNVEQGKEDFIQDYCKCGGGLSSSEMEETETKGGKCLEWASENWRAVGREDGQWMIQQNELLLGSPTFFSMIRPPVSTNWSPSGLSMSSLTETRAQAAVLLEGSITKGLLPGPWERYSWVAKLARHNFFLSASHWDRERIYNYKLTKVKESHCLETGRSLPED